MKVKNPLTVIAIFAGLSEGFSSIALIKLPADLQREFMYFVMAFPSAIALLFFVLLVFLNYRLFGPDDYKDERNYLATLKISKFNDERIGAEFVDIKDASFESEDVDLLRNQITKSLNDSYSSTRKEQILNYLSQGEAVTKDIRENLGVHHSYATKILRELNESGAVHRIERPGERGVAWSLRSAPQVPGETG